MGRGHHRRHQLALPSHVAGAIGPSPARAEPHDAAAWLPLPVDLHELPSIQVLLDGTTRIAVEPATTDSEVAVEVDLVALEAVVFPSPARAAPHDAAAWLPLPDDLHELPPVHELLAPDPELQAAVVAEAEALVQESLAAVEAVVFPSPARAEPHDAAAWLPLPVVDELPLVPELAAGARGDPFADPAAAGNAARPRRRLARLAPVARALFLVVLVVATATSGVWVFRQVTAPAGSAVTLVVDGDRIQFRSGVATVGALLAARGIGLAAGDAVTPPPGTSLADGMHVSVARAFPVTVDLDGKVRTVRTTATSAATLGEQLEVGKLVAVRGDPGRLAAGSTVEFRTRRGGRLEIDGQSVAFDSPSLTVGELLESYDVTLVGEDFSTPAPGARLGQGATVTVVRVGAQMTQSAEEIPFDEVRQPDPDLPIGETRVAQKGKPGVMTVTTRRRVENGQVVPGDGQVVSKVPTTPAKPHVVAYGTKADWHWDELARCESGGRWDTIDANPNGYDGGLGFHTRTWIEFGGEDFAPRAGYATREEQIIVGMRIYERYGWDPWGCANNVLHWS